MGATVKAPARVSTLSREGVGNQVLLPPRIEAMRALRICAGDAARDHLRRQGVCPADVRVIPGAAGGPKGLVLNPLDRFLFGHWLNAPALRPAGPAPI